MKRILSAALAGLVFAGIGFAAAASAEAAPKRSTICAKTSKGKVCTKFYKYNTKAFKAEAKRLKTAKNLPMDKGTRVFSIGYTAKNIEDGKAIWTVKAKNVKRFHVYVIVAKGNLCEYEDSPYCVWDAKNLGNGVGHSFFADYKNTPHYF